MKYYNGFKIWDVNKNETDFFIHLRDIRNIKKSYVKNKPPPPPLRTGGAKKLFKKEKNSRIGISHFF